MLEDPSMSYSEKSPPDGSVLTGRFFLSIKLTNDRYIKYKAKYVIAGYNDKLKELMVY